MDGKIVMRLNGVMRCVEWEGGDVVEWLMWWLCDWVDERFADV